LKLPALGTIVGPDGGVEVVLVKVDDVVEIPDKLEEEIVVPIRVVLEAV
jgi:hypothetical protein